MDNASLPSHLQEIIDKGYQVDQTGIQIPPSGGMFHIERKSIELRPGVGSVRPDGVPSIAFCFDGPFLPVRNGASYSLYNLMKTLGKSGKVLPILVLCNRGDSVENYYNQHFKTIFVDPEYYYNHNKQTEEIFVNNGVSAAQFCSSEGVLNLGLFVKKLGIKVVFDVQNVDYILEERLGHDKASINKARSLQVRAVGESDYVLCRSEVDRALLVDLGASGNAMGVYNGGIDVEQFAVRDVVQDRKKMVFLAHMYYEPNENALTFMVNEVLPKLDAGYTLTVIGNIPEAILLKYRGNKVIRFKQGVNDLSTELLQYDIALAPIFEGSGTRLKVLDYLASGLPVVATGLAIEGLLAGIEEVVSVADDAEAIAAEIEAMTQNPDSFADRSRQGRRYVRENYDWKNQLTPFLKAYDVELEAIEK